MSLLTTTKITQGSFKLVGFAAGESAYTNLEQKKSVEKHLPWDKIARFNVLLPKKSQNKTL